MHEHMCVSSTDSHDNRIMYCIRGTYICEYGKLEHNANT